MSSSQSPITGIIDEAEVFIDFGKHEGITVKDLADVDPDLYQSLASDKMQGVYAIRRTRDKKFRLYLNPLAQLDQ